MTQKKYFERSLARLLCHDEWNACNVLRDTHTQILPSTLKKNVANYVRSNFLSGLAARVYVCIRCQQKKIELKLSEK